ncbi:hypothetical protein SAMN06296036_107253 [Pseudobacteriovorax antillogorgiicola]|uniref:Uncharacterized protein n=1 Tax=Pseudobacteriovorax antillogorgiicola TaxID=1513793 RepID=A0A1Y6BQH0_9BACT|nr:hypothetical protein EDD56_10719 [Pseudobacteriovorax antillogorgiicola]SMF22943.1 hypothetical protein SAMN06296036_107253 [Pseudobacteriovorax antillogorgiicola]
MRINWSNDSFEDYANEDEWISSPPTILILAVVCLE